MTQQHSSRSKLLQTLLGLGIVVLAGGLAWGASSVSSEAGYGGVGPNFLPWVVSAALLVCGVLCVAHALTGGFRELEEGSGDERAHWKGFIWVSAGLLLNAMLMTVFERVREFGVLKAIGMGPWTVLSIVVLESLLQTAVAAVMDGGRPVISAGSSAAKGSSNRSNDVSAAKARAIATRCCCPPEISQIRRSAVPTRPTRSRSSSRLRPRSLFATPAYLSARSMLPPTDFHGKSRGC